MKILDMLHEINFNEVNFPLFKINALIKQNCSGENSAYRLLVSTASNFVSAEDIESKKNFLMQYSDALYHFASEEEFLYDIQQELSRITDVKI